MFRAAFVLVFLSLPAVTVAAFAPAVSLLGPDISLTGRMAAARSHVSAEFEGTGDRLMLTYTSQEPLDLFLFPLHGDSSPDAAFALTTSLPEGVEQEVSLDLTVSPAWSPGPNRYRVHLLSRTQEPPVLHAVSVSGGSSRLPWVALRQILTVEPWQPSAYHRLRGSMVFGIPFAVVFGFLTMGIAIVVAIAQSREARIFLILLCIGVLLYGVRTGADLVRISIAHVRVWQAEGTYAQAGAAYAIAGALRESGGGERPFSVFVCHDGTSYLPTLLQYLLYPIPVSDVPDPMATHVVVIQKVQWNEGSDALDCGGIRLPVQRVRSFHDGSVLYRMLPS